MRSGGTLWENRWTYRGEKWKKVSAVENKWLLRFRKLTTCLKMVYYFQKWECRVTWQIGSCGSQCFHHLFGWCWWIHGNATWKTWKYFSEMLYYCFLLCLRLENHMVDGCRCWWVGKLLTSREKVINGFFRHWKKNPLTFQKKKVLGFFQIFTCFWYYCQWQGEYNRRPFYYSSGGNFSSVSSASGSFIIFKFLFAT